MVPANPDTFGNTRFSKPTIVVDLKASPLVEDKSNPTIQKVYDGFYSNRRIVKPLPN